MSTVHSTDPTAGRRIGLPAAPVAVGVVYAVCVLGMIALFGLEVAVTDVDPWAAEGPYESMIGIGLFGTAALIVAAAVAALLARRPERARVGALVFVAISVITLPIFWSGVPGIFGVCAAWLGGLTRGAHPQVGSARVAAIVGGSVALLNMVVSIGTTVLSMATGG